MRFLLSIAFLIVSSSCTQNKISKVDFLIGNWKVENKDQFEVWESSDDNTLAGYSYRLVDGQKVVSETLTIELNENSIIYKATVPDQNQGNTILFYLNENIDGLLSFENPEHDFPTKIQYKKVSEDTLEVTVKGDGKHGFSYKQVRQ